MPRAILVTKRRAAELLNVTPKTVQRMISDGRLKPAETIEQDGRALIHRFRESDVMRLVRQREQVAS